MVVFEYLPEHNQFNMRFVDDNGNDIEYEGKLGSDNRRVRGSYIYTVCETHING
ncbi:hypothetical protein A2U01_0084290, partial [Trifolium medium]|nr:hypothetical protein [Trifolium medium]